MFLIITILYASMIFALSSSPDPPGSAEGKSAVPYFSHVAHTALYFGLAFCVLETLKRYPDGIDINIYILTFVIVVLYGISDEVHQYFVPYRTFMVIDIFFDTVGASILVIGRYILDKKENFFISHTLR